MHRVSRLLLMSAPFVLVLISIPSLFSILRAISRLGTEKAHSAYLLVYGSLILVDLVRIARRSIGTGTLVQPLFSSTAAAAIGLIFYARFWNRHLNFVLGVFAVVAAAGMLSVVEAVFARIQGRLADYDMSLGSAGPTLLFSLSLVAISVMGM